MSEKNKVGRPRIFQTPEDLWKVFEEYAEHVKANPLFKYESTKDGSIIAIPLTPPITMEGFNLFIFYKGLGEGAHQYFENKGEAYNEFFGVCTRIREAVRNNHIAGGMVGLYNSSLTARLNGLTEKREEHHTGNAPISIVVRDMSKPDG
jgi:hypothetical protein